MCFVQNEEKQSNLEQFSVWIVDLGQDFTQNDTFNSCAPLGHEQSGIRPVIIISPTEYNNISGTPVVMCCSTSEKKANNYYSIPVKWNDIHKPTWVNFTQIRTFDKERFTYFAGNIEDSFTIKKIKERFNKFMFGNEINNTENKNTFPEELNGFKLVVRKKRNNHY